ncbi:hypothetical protein U1Q18_048451 [Sarracenia purpurea var. burkii]
MLKFPAKSVAVMCCYRCSVMCCYKGCCHVVIRQDDDTNLLLQVAVIQVRYSPCASRACLGADPSVLQLRNCVLQVCNCDARLAGAAIRGYGSCAVLPTSGFASSQCGPGRRHLLGLAVKVYCPQP